MKNLFKSILVSALATITAISFASADHHEKKDKKGGKKGGKDAEKSAVTDADADKKAPGPGGPGGPTRRGARDDGRRPGGPDRPGGPSFEAIDANGDGKIAKSEFLAFQIERVDEGFERADANADGTLSKEEAATMFQRGGPRPGAGAPGGQGGRPPFMGGGGIAQMDSDGDGAVSQEEFLAASRERQQGFFKMLDANADGKVTQKEAEEAMGRMRDRFRGGQGQGPGRGQGTRPGSDGRGTAPRPQRPPAE